MSEPRRTHFEALVRALRKHHHRVARKRDALRGDLDEAQEGVAFRRYAETLLVHLKQVPARAASVALPDPSDSGRTMEIELDPNVAAQVNAARYFKKAAKCERALEEIPPRIAALEREVTGLKDSIRRAEVVLDGWPADESEPAEDITEERESEIREVEAILSALPINMLKAIGAPLLKLTPPAVKPVAKKSAIPQRFLPRRLRSKEGWEVMIGRSNEGNDYLTLKIARGEDYWFHVHGAPGSHVVLRRGKGKNEPSKQTLAEVASWTAFYSQARNAGKVPVIYTLKKYVRKPRGVPPGTVTCEREKMIMVRPVEPGPESLEDQATAGQ
jgi:predicted ribosome quality control (RQC) complex YloA/Tae2 family protein